MDARVLASTIGADGKVQIDENFLRITREKAEEEKMKRKANTIQYLEPQQGGRIIRPLPKTTNFKRKARHLEDTSISTKCASCLMLVKPMDTLGMNVMHFIIYSFCQKTEVHFS